jgi:hypothetical protein
MLPVWIFPCIDNRFHNKLIRVPFLELISQIGMNCLVFSALI